MSQKAENLLNLALDATSEEREKSLELEVGYQPLDQEWDLIIKYSGNLEAVREIASSVTELSNEYAILTVPESQRKHTSIHHSKYRPWASIRSSSASSCPSTWRSVCARRHTAAICSSVRRWQRSRWKACSNGLYLISFCRSLP